MTIGPTHYILIAASAFAAGVMNAIAGGGTFLMFPTLIAAAGLSEKVANMTCTIGLWPGAAASVAAVREDIKRLPRSMIWGLSIISIIGGGVGAMLLLATQETTFRYAVPWLLLFATALFGFSKPIARWAGHKHGERSLRWTLLVGLIQVFVAIYGGYFGAGIGVLMLGTLSFAGLGDIHQVNALKALLATLINVTGAAVFLCSALQVAWGPAAVVAGASVAGGFLGMRFGRRIKPDYLRGVILGIGVVLTAAYFYKCYAGG